jgi:hypothetical protein
MTWTTDLTRELASGTYEITVAGALGPVLRAAMHPLVATTSGHCTTLRAALGRRWDVADLLAVLDAKGLEVTDVAVRSATPRPGRVARSPGGTVHPARVTRPRAMAHGLDRWPSTRR